ncbi:MAG: hypothetical protein ABJB76_03460 [Candidatus Nitrosocosmicus sp.]
MNLKNAFIIVGITILVLATLAPSPYSQSAKAQQCDNSLWDHVYLAKIRLSIQELCISISGTIMNRTPQLDGDIHLLIKLDPKFTNMLTPANFEHLRGLLVVEPVCQSNPINPLSIESCQGFHHNIDIPADGTHVIITGSYVLENRHGGWAEIHPVTSIVASSSAEFSNNVNESATTEPSP